MNRGDTAYLLLNYTLNGDPLQEDAYREIELQINKDTAYRRIKKLLSKGEIVWGTLPYEEDGTQMTFTGYYAALSQEETFKMSAGKNEVQVRVLVDNEVGSSAISSVNIGQTLSKKVLV